MMLYNRFNEVQVVEALAGPEAPLPTRILEGTGDKGPCILVFWEFVELGFGKVAEYWLEVYGPMHYLHKSYTMRTKVQNWYRDDWRTALATTQGTVRGGWRDPKALKRLYELFVEA